MRMSYKALLKLLAVLFVMVGVSATTVFKAYPLGEDYFEKIYLVNHNGHEYYLTISCKEQNMLSISITPSKDFL